MLQFWVQIAFCKTSDKFTFNICQFKKPCQINAIPTVAVWFSESELISVIISFLAFCSNPCIHGVCIGPEECECQPGFGGPTCNVCKWKPPILIFRVCYLI